MAAVQAREDPTRMESRRYVSFVLRTAGRKSSKSILTYTSKRAATASSKHVRELAQHAEMRKEDRRAAAIRKAREDIGHHYSIYSVVGEGGYGIVFSAVNRHTGSRVAVKRVSPFEHHLLAIRTLRELRLLRYFQEYSGCENIIKLLDVVIPGDRCSFQDIYFVQEIMDTDLYRVVRTQSLSYDHAQYFTYQILRGLKPIHAAGVLHRDIKPSNLLVNANCDLKICDFGLARNTTQASPHGRDLQLTEYVATRWYRAPEIMLSSKTYTKAVDIWSVGCTLFEMLTGEPLFPGKDYHHQMLLILDVLGTASVDSIVSQCSPRALDYVRALPWCSGRSWTSLLPNVQSDAIDFLSRAVTMDPNARMTVDECLAHPFVAPYHDPSDEPGAPPLEQHACEYDVPPTLNTDVYRQALWDDNQIYARHSLRSSL